MVFFQGIRQGFGSGGADGVAPQAGVGQAEKPRLAKLEWHRPSLSQMPPHGTAEVGHQASSFREWRPSPARSGRVGSSPAVGREWFPVGMCAWQELGKGNTYSSTIRLLFTSSDLARALAPLLLI